jgi:exopolysaccharide biosynthesis protein
MPSIAYYVVADLADKSLRINTDTTLFRRISPSAYYERNQHPLVVVNGTFFDLKTSQNLDVVMMRGKMVSYNVNSTALKGKDTFLYRYTTRAAIGINKKRKADAAWLYSDSSARYPIAYQGKPPMWKGNGNEYTKKQFDAHAGANGKRWKMYTAIGGGPMLVQDGKIRITNNEEVMFTGKAIDDRHPRTVIGYTRDHKLIILAVEGRNKGVAEGATLTQLAEIMISLGCVEALNLDGGGSSCLLVNGRETIKPSDKTGQRAMPAVLLIGNQ